MEPSEERKSNSEKNQLIVQIQRFWHNIWLKSAVLALLLLFLFQGIFFELFKVNNRDMEGRYSMGDVLLIKKNPSRLKHGQVILLQYPLPDTNQSSTFFIQRLVGLSGDTLLLSNKILYVNGIEQEELPFQKHNYFLKTRFALLDSNFLNKYGLNDGGLVSSGFDYSYALTSKQKEELEKDSLILRIVMKTEKKNMFDATCFPGSLHCNWNADQYGKIYVPKKNDSISLDTTIISLYEDLISKYEQNSLSISHDSIFINGRHSTSYKVKQNYFITLGDNRDNSVDSRYWGFLPESLIRGKVLLRLISAK